MSLQTLSPGQPIGLMRDEVGICVPVHGATGRLAECLRSVLAHTDAEIPLLLADDASADPEIRNLVEQVAEARPDRRIYYLRHDEQMGFVGNCNAAFDLLAPADVVLLNSDCVVSRGWMGALREAAGSDSRIATVSALSNSATIISVPDRNRPAPNIPQDWSLDTAAEAIREASLGLRPRIPTAIGHCVYIRRAALDLTGGFDWAFAPGYEEEVDFSQRCLIHGMFHVAADDCFVLHYGGASFGGGPTTSALKDAHHRIIVDRYRWFDPWITEVQQDVSGPLARSLGAARRALKGLTITIDGRILTPFMTGTQLHVLEVITALDALGEAQLRVIVPPDLGDYARDQLTGLKHVQLHPAGDPVAEPTDVVHRPYQVSSADDLLKLREWGQRVVVTHQDLIAFENPGYFTDYAAWRSFRRLTREALALADHVLFFSRHAADEAVAADLVDWGRGTVVHIGTNHQLTRAKPPAAMPRGAGELGDRPFLLCLGTDFLHKNRLFAIRLLEALRDEHGWDGALVLAGPHVAHGSSSGEEAAYLALRPELNEHVLDLAAVDEAGKTWLTEHASAMVYPTVIEGFGLIPFEAADAGLPCLFAHETALAELFPAEAARLVPWDPGASAAATMPLLVDEDERRRHVELLQATAAQLTWSKTAHGLMEVYRRTAIAPPREASRLAADQIELEARMHQLEALLDAERRRTKHEHDVRLEVEAHLNERLQKLLLIENDSARRSLALDDAVFDYELRLILMGLGHRPLLRKLVFGPFRALYRLGYLLRHRTRPRNRSTQKGST